MSAKHDDVHEGSCLCGHVRFRVSGQPNNVSNCHCRMCQKAAGAAFMTFAEFPRERVVWTGAEPVWRASSDKAERGFCPNCGSAVTFRFAGGDSIDLAVALFDEPGAFPPREDIFTESRSTWVALDEDLPHFPKYPKR